MNSLKHSTSNKKKKTLLVGIPLLAFSLILLFYLLFLQPKLASQKADALESELKSFLVNDYTGAVKEELTDETLTKTKRKLDELSDSSQKKALLSLYDSIKLEHDNQTKLLTQLKELEAADDKAPIGLEGLTVIQSQVSVIKNDSLRSKLMKTVSIMIDRITVDEELKSLLKDTGINDDELFFKLKAKASLSHYSETKELVEKRIQDLDKLVSEKKKQEKKEQEEKEEQEAKRRLETINNGKSTVLYSESVPSGVQKLFDQNKAKTAVIIEDNSLRVMQKDGRGLVKTARVINGENRGASFIKGDLILDYKRVINGLVFGDRFMITTDRTANNAFIVSESAFSSLLDELNHEGGVVLGEKEKREKNTNANEFTVG